MSIHLLSHWNVLRGLHTPQQTKPEVENNLGREQSPTQWRKKLFFLFLETNLFVLLILPWVEEILPLAVWGERVVGFVRQGRAIGFGVQPSLEVFRMDFVISIFYFRQRSYLWDVNVGVVTEPYLVVGHPLFKGS